MTPKEVLEFVKEKEIRQFDLRLRARTSPIPSASSPPTLSKKAAVSISTLSGCDLMKAAMEVNVFHYGPGEVLGTHRDLPEKLVTHVLYFKSWNGANGGCRRDSARRWVFIGDRPIGQLLARGLARRRRGGMFPAQRECDFLSSWRSEHHVATQ